MSTTDFNIPNVQFDPVGFDIVVTFYEDETPRDITGADNCKIRLQFQDGSSKDFDAVITGAPANGQIKYTTAAGDLDVSGLTQVQGYVELPSGFKGWGSIATFVIKANLTAPA